MMHRVEVWSQGYGKENSKIQGSFVLLIKELRIPKCAANKLMNSNSKGRAEKQR